MFPLAGSDDLLNLTSDLFTVSVTSFVSVPSTVAVFLITFVKLPSVNSSTVTSKLRVDSPLADTGTVIPLTNVSSVSCVAELFTLTLPSTKLVPSGIVSITTTFFAKSPSFVTVIVYVIFSPSTTYAKLFSVSDSFSCEIIGSTYVCIVSFVGSSSTVAMFLICVLLFMSFTLTLNSTVLFSPACKSTSIPCAKLSAFNSVLDSSPTFMLPSTNGCFCWNIIFYILLLLVLFL